MEITTIDRSNMRNVIIASADQLKEGLALAQNVKINGAFSNVVICGMGGSALPARLIETLKITTKVPIYVHSDYNLPWQANKKSLVICISYSGNTEETVSALKEAVKNNMKIVAIATGGDIANISQERAIPLVKIPSGIQPRCATGYIFSALAKALSNAGIVEDLSSEILNTSQQLKNMALALEKEGKQLAEKLHKKIPVIYASKKFAAIAQIWKIKCNENSKVPAFWNYFPELNHNEMSGYSNIKNQISNIKNFYVVILKDSNDHPRILKRMDLLATMLQEKGIATEFVAMQNGSLMFKIFSTLILGDWTSYYLALEYGIDPTPVAMVEEFKKMMRE